MDTPTKDVVSLAGAAVGKIVRGAKTNVMGNSLEWGRGVAGHDAEDTAYSTGTG